MAKAPGKKVIPSWRFQLDVGGLTLSSTDLTGASEAVGCLRSKARYPFAQRQHLRAHPHIDAEQRSTMPLAEEGQTISEIFKSGGARQFEGERARLEYGHHVILR
jgi:hypothetical protein